MELWKTIFLYNPVVFRVHVSHPQGVFIWHLKYMPAPYPLGVTWLEKAQSTTMRGFPCPRHPFSRSRWSNNSFLVHPAHGPALPSKAWHRFLARRWARQQRQREAMALFKGASRRHALVELWEAMALRQRRAEEQLVEQWRWRSTGEPGPTVGEGMIDVHRFSGGPKAKRW